MLPFRSSSVVHRSLWAAAFIGSGRIGLHRKLFPIGNCRSGPAANGGNQRSRLHSGGVAERLL